MEKKVSVVNQTKGKLPSLPFVLLKNDILGQEYSLSIAYVNETESQEINKKYRRKNKPTNVLSFSLRKNEGEIILCPAVINREAKNFDKTSHQFLGFLVIHGMLHLKGLEHSSTMDKLERFYFKKYDQKYFSRNRRGIFDDESRGGRIHQRRKKS